MMVEPIKTLFRLLVLVVSLRLLFINQRDKVKVVSW